MRRIQRRMGIQQFEYLKDYNKYLYHTYQLEVYQSCRKIYLIGLLSFEIYICIFQFLLIK